MGKKKFLGYVKPAFFLIFKIRPENKPFSAHTHFNYSAANFHPTEDWETILESLGRGKKDGVFEFAKKCPNKR